MTPMTQAQTATTGQIVGVVTDPSWAVVAGAKVALTSDAGVRRESAAGGNDRYTFPLLDPGTYRLEMTLSGFPSVKLEGIAVKITESSVVDVALKVAGLPTTVSVTGESPLVQTESSARGTVIDENEMRELLLPTRDFQQLLTRLREPRVPSRTPPSWGAAMPSIDSLQEFIVQTSVYDASEGRNAGGVVATVTKSGVYRRIAPQRLW